MDILNNKEFEQITIVIAKEKKHDIFTDIITELQRMSDDGGYFLLVDYDNPTELELKPKQ